LAATFTPGHLGLGTCTRIRQLHALIHAALRINDTEVQLREEGPKRYPGEEIDGAHGV
jgi:hypothetical protein